MVDIEADQERLAKLMATLVNNPRDELLYSQIQLFRDGLELRIREFDEECRRLHATQRRMQHKVDEAEASFELEAIQSNRLVDPKLVEKLVEQRRVIRLQQEELEQLTFERDVLSDDAARLRQACLEQVPDDDYGESFQIGVLSPAAAAGHAPTGSAGPMTPGAGPQLGRSPGTTATPPQARSGGGVPGLQVGRHTPPPQRPQAALHAGGTPGSAASDEAASEQVTVDESASSATTPRGGSLTPRRSRFQLPQPRPGTGGSTLRRGYEAAPSEAGTVQQPRRSSASGRNFQFGPGSSGAASGAAFM
eukprot:gnl/TRDRNA2_/TRDRNA2_73759_c1_seq1.p1 gnl/TRDRNA2_/TRDRNA2_73759_c1~~gnl/TRDRNA2_/TRDRNA2_73759_c1_seq1.p1  ORF type:complete len:316 (-),score=76.48 gnl/TRDRNA2_/TRDRNA2_73759_c1_seq1:40-957(-)